MVSKTYSTFPRGIESSLYFYIFGKIGNIVRPIRHSHGELKEATHPAPLVLTSQESKTYSTFPRGIESWHSDKLIGNRPVAQVRPIRHSHGELKVKIYLSGYSRCEVVRPIRHSHGELKDY